MDLVSAVKRRRFQKALELIAEGTDVNAPGARGETALLWAVIHGDERVVSAVLRAGAEATPRTKSKRAPGNSAALATPLHFATKPDRIGILKMLLAAGSEVDAMDAVGLTPLGAAAAVGNAEATNLLLAAGADPNHPCQPLLLGAKEGHAEVVRLLLEAGAHHTPDLASLYPPIRLAMVGGHEAVVQLLRRAGAVWPSTAPSRE